jgi:hypothetical protein
VAKSGNIIITKDTKIGADQSLNLLQGKNLLQKKDLVLEKNLLQKENRLPSLIQVLKLGRRLTLITIPK